MSAEILQLAFVLGGIAVVAVLWLTFIYKPRRTGEGDPRGVQPDRDPEDKEP